MVGLNDWELHNLNSVILFVVTRGGMNYNRKYMKKSLNKLQESGIVGFKVQSRLQIQGKKIASDATKTISKWC